MSIDRFAFLLQENVSQGLVFRQAPPLWAIILIIVPAIIAFTAFFYRSGREAPAKMRGLLAALRILTLLLITLLLFEPALETQVVETRKALAIVLCDVSASMSHKDDYATSPSLASQLREAAQLKPGEMLDGKTRLDLVKGVLDAPERSLLDRLAQENELRIFTFGEGLGQASSLQDLNARDRVTALGRAIEKVLEEPEVKSAPVGGLVVITDGKNTAGPMPDAAAEIAKRRKIPVHCVGVGDPKALKDVELVSLNAPSVVLLGDTMVFDVRLRHRGFEGQSVAMRLSEDGRDLPLLAPRSPVRLGQDEDEQTVQLQFKPAREGRFKLKIEARPLPGEFDAKNNARFHDVIVRREKLKVLYVDQLPRWEYRKLQDFLTRGRESFEVQCLLLSAQVGFIQESSPGVEPLETFPQTPEALFQYDVILFGDVDPEALAPDSARQQKVMENIRTFVENGGGFGMIAGDRFAPWAYRDTPIGDLLPIEVDPGASAGANSRGDSEGFSFKVTNLGRQHPVTQLVEDPERNRSLWEGGDADADGLHVPPSWWYARVKKAKPGAQVLAVHSSDVNRHGAIPVLVSGHFGQGPVIFQGIDDTWRWFQWQGAFLHHRFWGNMVKHLARTRLYAGDKRFQLSSNRSEYIVGDRVSFSAYVKDRSFRPATHDSQVMLLKHPDDTGKPIERIVLPLADKGLYTKTLMLEEQGDYEAWIPPADPGSDEKLSPISFRVTVSDLERREPILDEITLRKLANDTGGQYVLLPEAPRILEEVSGGTVEIPRQRRFIGLRDAELPWVYWMPAVFLALLTAEWLLRRRFRLL